MKQTSLATLAGLIPHYVLFYLAGTPLLTNAIAEWIMARTPSRYALWILDAFGPWAKPFAMTGGLAILGAAVLLVTLTRYRLAAAAVLAPLIALAFAYYSIPGHLSFWLPVLLVLTKKPNAPSAAVRQRALTRRESLAMAAGTLFVAAESFLREQSLTSRAVQPRKLVSFNPPADTFAPSLVRPPITPAGTFYAMSKNTVDPGIDPSKYRLNITFEGRTLRALTYNELLSLSGTQEYVTLRCVSNTLQSDLMGTALWTGLRLNQIIDPRSLPEGIVEIAAIGVDGHGDSFSPAYLLSDDAMLAIGMNGETLNRTHGFPARLIVPRYYGFKNVKWLGELSLVRKPYFGTWPKMGYTKQPLVHTASHIDRIREKDGALHLGGVSFAGDRGIKAVQVRAGKGDWVDAQLEAPLSRFTWTRWRAILPGGASIVEARALDNSGKWQDSEEGPLFPDGVKGPTIRKVT